MSEGLTTVPGADESDEPGVDWPRLLPAGRNWLRTHGSILQPTTSKPIKPIKPALKIIQGINMAATPVCGVVVIPKTPASSVTMAVPPVTGLVMGLVELAGGGVGVGVAPGGVGFGVVGGGVGV